MPTRSMGSRFFKRLITYGTYNADVAMALIRNSEVIIFSSRSGDGANILGAKSTISCGNSVTK